MRLCALPSSKQPGHSPDLQPPSDKTPPTLAPFQLAEADVRRVFTGSITFQLIHHRPYRHRSTSCPPAMSVIVHLFPRLPPLGCSAPLPRTFAPPPPPLLPVAVRGAASSQSSAPPSLTHHTFGRQHSPGRCSLLLGFVSPHPSEAGIRLESTSCEPAASSLSEHHETRSHRRARSAAAGDSCMSHNFHRALAPSPAPAPLSPPVPAALHLAPATQVPT